jgi:hypothetical protein
MPISVKLSPGTNVQVKVKNTSGVLDAGSLSIKKYGANVITGAILVTVNNKLKAKKLDVYNAVTSILP